MSTVEATRDRILAAATHEFAEHGIAGARVDRIALRSGMSKPMIYTYFGAKDALFDAVFTAHVVANADRVPFTPTDLTGYAVRLYDDYVADPALLRLVAWKRLEREPTGYLFDGLQEVDAEHLAGIAVQQEARVVRPDLSPRDVWSLLVSTASTWAQGSITEVATAADAEGAHERRRTALAAVVRSGLLVDGGRA
jgi:AcrR family transcriptional regulator